MYFLHVESDAGPLATDGIDILIVADARAHREPRRRRARLNPVPD